MYKLATKLAAVAVGLLTFNCVFVTDATAQLYNAPNWGNQPGYGLAGAGAGVDSTGRYLGNPVGTSQYNLNGYDPITGRRLDYGGGAYPGYGYGRGYGYNGYGRNYYGYYNGAVTSQRTGCVFWLTLALTTMLAFKVFA